MLTTYALQFPGVGCSLLTDFKLNVGFQKEGETVKTTFFRIQTKIIL